MLNSLLCQKFVLNAYERITQNVIFQNVALHPGERFIEGRSLYVLFPPSPTVAAAATATAAADAPPMAIANVLHDR